MKWPKRQADNSSSGRDLLLSSLITPVVVFAAAYLMGLGMRALAIVPSQAVDPMQIAVFMTITCTFFLWLLSFMIYFGPGEAALREERRQEIQRRIDIYMKRYPDAKPMAEEFGNPC